MPKTLIVPVDGSEASERALDVAQLFALRFAACDVVVMTAAGADDLDRRRSFDALTERVGSSRVRSEFVEDRDAPEAIAALAASEPDAVVCMATHGRGRLTAPFLGNVATQVLCRTAAPIMLVGPHCETARWQTPPNIVTCWAGDGSRAILSYAKEWRDALGAELWLETVYHPLDPQVAHARAEFEPAIALLAGDDGLHLLALRDEYPAGAIVRSARDVPATLLAMTTHARTGLARTALGSVATDVVHHSPCPVLVVHQS